MCSEKALEVDVQGMSKPYGVSVGVSSKSCEIVFDLSLSSSMALIFSLQAPCMYPGCNQPKSRGH